MTSFGPFQSDKDVTEYYIKQVVGGYDVRSVVHRMDMNGKRHKFDNWVSGTYSSEAEAQRTLRTLL